MTIQEQAESKKEYIISEYENGRSSTDISRELGINSYFICKILNDSNVKMRNTNKMSPEEINNLIPQMKKMFESGSSVAKIAKYLGLDKSTTNRRLKSAGCDTSIKSTERTDKIVNHKEEIIEMYLSGLSTCKISKKFKCSSSAIWNLLEKNEITCRDHNKYSANYDYFEKIDSDEKAWLIGIIYADGHVKTKEDRWGISLIDGDLVKKISEIVSYTGPVYCKEATERFKGYESKPMTELSIASPKMKSDLIKLGVIPRKTFTLQYPTIEQIPLEFRNAFIRGYLDGDGSIGFTISKNSKSPRFTVQFTGTKEMCEGIANEVLARQICNSAKVYKASSKNDKNTYYCFISGVSCVAFLDWIYKDSTIHLERKWRKYMQLKEYFQYKHLLITPGGNKKGWKDRQKSVCNIETSILE